MGLIQSKIIGQKNAEKSPLQFYLTNVLYVDLVREKMQSFVRLLDFQSQWGSEYQVCANLEMWKCVRLSNGADFEWHLNDK